MATARHGMLTLFVREAPRDTAIIAILGLLAAGTQATALFMVTRAAEQLPTNPAASWIALGALPLVLLFALTKRLTLQRAVVLSEHVAASLALRLATQLRWSRLRRIEQLDRESLHARLTSDIAVLSSAGWVGILAVECLVLMTVCVLVLFALSPIIASVIVALASTAVLILRLQQRGQLEAIQAVVNTEQRFFFLLNQVFEGFKELKLSARRRADFFDHFLLPVATQARQLQVQAGRHYASNIVILDFHVYLALGAVAFVLPAFGIMAGVVATIGVLLYSWEQMIALITFQPLLNRAAKTLQRLHHLEQQLAAIPAQRQPPAPAFSTLRLADAGFDYHDATGDKSFSLGPVNLAIHQGQIVFITGPNGSGKSTLLKLLSGLYPPTRGVVLVDDALVAVEAQRALFVAVFADFHLFDRLYGVTQMDPQRVHLMLERLDLSRKTSLRDGAFSNTRLSTGQRKRLALIAATLEDRPVLLLDEWAADQDPEFRAFFYQELLPELKREGRTVVAVSHDDRYFHLADRLVRLDLGRIVEDRNLHPGQSHDLG